MKRLPLILTLLAVLALSASIAYWVMELYKPKQRPLAAMSEAVMPEPSADAAATLFGGQAVTVVASNYQLTGVVAAGIEGVAILVADGQPPKALKVGSEIASGVVLKEVFPKYVMLSEGGVLKRIDLATDDKAAASMSMGAPIDQGQSMQQQMPQQQMPQQQMAPPPPPPTPTPQPVQQQMPPPQPVTPIISNPMTVPEMPNASVPVPPPQPGQPMEPPPPPQPVQMPAPTRNMSGAQPPTQ